MKDKRIPSRAALAQKLHTGQSTVGRWWNTGSMPRTLQLEALARVLEVTPEWLLHGASGPQATSEGASVLREETSVAYRVEPKAQRVDSAFHEWEETRLRAEKDALDQIKICITNLSHKTDTEVTFYLNSARRILEDYAKTVQDLRGVKPPQPEY